MEAIALTPPIARPVPKDSRQPSQSHMQSPRKNCDHTARHRVASTTWKTERDHATSRDQHVAEAWDTTHQSRTARPQDYKSAYVSKRHVPDKKELDLDGDKNLATETFCSS